MNQFTFHCKKDGVQFIFESSITKGQFYEFQNQNPDTIEQQTQAVLASQNSMFAHALFEHMTECDGEIVTDRSTLLIAD